MKRLTSLLLASAMALSLAACGNADQGGDKSTAQKVSATTLKDIEAPGEPETIPEALQVDFNKRFHYAELEDVYAALHEQAPDITEFYAIGSTWQERSLWCLEITNKSIPEDQKIGIGVFGPIHGEEPEAAISAMYTAWWMILNRDTDYMKAMLDQYIIYVVPAINPTAMSSPSCTPTAPTCVPWTATVTAFPSAIPMPISTVTASSPTSIPGLRTRSPLRSSAPTGPSPSSTASVWRALTGTATTFSATIPAAAASI